jgi:DNA-directed RNA polymerase specialized sigma24 family protein
VTDELALISAEETDTLASLYATQYDPLVRLGTLLTGSIQTAEDIVQDVVLRFYLDLPEAEIADALDMRPGTVKSSLHRALAHLKTGVER